MSYSYLAIDAEGRETRGSLDVSDQNEALRRIREMGFFPTKLLEQNKRKPGPAYARRGARVEHEARPIQIPWLGGRVKPGTLAIFTRQIATLVEAGMPLLRSLRTLQEQEESPAMRRVIGDLALAIENGSSFAEAIAQHPRIFDRLYLNMVKAGEIGGALEVTLTRLAEFMEKARKIKG